MMRYLLAVIFAVFFIGCGGGSSSSEVSTTQELNPSVTLLSLNIENGKASGTLLFKENNSFYFNAKFSNIALSNGTCVINNYTLSSTQINSGGVVTFNADLNCSDNPTILVSFNETASYMDTVVKEVTKFFTKSIPLIQTATSNPLPTTTTTTTTTTTATTDLGFVKLKVMDVEPSSVLLQPGSSYTFYVYTFDENNNPASVPVKISPPLSADGKVIGEFDTYQITTDDKGKGSFTYIAPATIESDEINLSVPVIFPGDEERNISITLKKNSVIPSKVSVTPSSVSLQPGGVYTFSVYTFDSENNPISVPVRVSPPIDSEGEMVGEFDRYSLITDENGRGSFTYTAPSAIDTDEKDINVSVIFPGDIERNVSIMIQKITTVTINPTKIILVPGIISVAGGSQYKIKILTLDDNNRGISAEVLIPHPIDENNNSWGSFSAYTVTTDDNGEGEVTFTATDNVNNLEGNLSVPFVVPNINLIQNLTLVKPPSLAIPKSYAIYYQVPPSVNLNSIFEVNLQIKEENSNELVNDENITEINLSSENHLVYFENNSSIFTTQLTKVNNVNIPIYSSTVSGIDIIDVNASVDENGTVKVVQTKIPVVVISGAVHTISINYVKGVYNTQTGIFEQTYTIHAVDKYSNPVAKGTKITVGAVVGVKEAGNNGAISPVEGSDTSEFNDSDKTFSDDLVGNTLIVKADENHTDPAYLGGWIIDSVKSATELILASQYFGEAEENLSYVIGNEKMYDVCGETIVVGDIDSEDGTYATDENGIAYVTLKYDPYLVGKTIYLYANSYQESRVGVSKKVLLDGAFINKLDFINDISTFPNTAWLEYGENGDTKGGYFEFFGIGGTVSILNNEGTAVVPEATLAQNSPVKLKILTPNNCEFTDNTTEKELNTSCNGYVYFEVKFTADGNNSCEVIPMF